MPHQDPQGPAQAHEGPPSKSPADAGAPDSFPLGERIVRHGFVGTVRYVGTVRGTSGLWLGVEWDDPARGKHDGTHGGERYFHLQFPPSSSSSSSSSSSFSRTAGSFVRPHTCRKGRPLLTVLRELYPCPLFEVAQEEQKAQAAGLPEPEIRRVRARVKARTLAVQKSVHLSSALADGQWERLVRSPVEGVGGEGTLCHAVPDLVQLNLSQHLLPSWNQVVDLVRHLPHLQDLSLNGNRLAPLERDAEGRPVGPLFAYHRPESHPHENIEEPKPPSCSARPETSRSRPTFSSPEPAGGVRRQDAHPPSVREERRSDDCSPSQLICLHLSHTLVSLSDTLEVTNRFMPHLAHMDMGYNRIGDTEQQSHQPAAPSPVPTLASVSVSVSTPIKHAALQSLHVAGNGLSSWSDLFSSLDGLPSLVQLDLGDNPLPPLQEEDLARLSRTRTSSLTPSPQVRTVSSMPAFPQQPQHAPGTDDGVEAGHGGSEVRVPRNPMLVYRPDGWPMKSLLLTKVALGWTDVQYLDHLASQGDLFCPGPPSLPSLTASASASASDPVTDTQRAYTGIQNLVVSFDGPTREQEEPPFGQFLTPDDTRVEGMLRSPGSRSWSDVSPLVGRAGLVARLPDLLRVNHTDVSHEERRAAERAWVAGAQRALRRSPPTRSACELTPQGGQGGGEEEEEEEEDLNRWAAACLGEPRLAHLARKHDMPLLPSATEGGRAPTSAAAQAAQAATLAGSLLHLRVVLEVVARRSPEDPDADPDLDVAAEQAARRYVHRRETEQKKKKEEGEMDRETEIHILPSATGGRMLRARLARVLGLRARRLGVALAPADGSGSRALREEEHRTLGGLEVGSGDTLLVLVLGPVGGGRASKAQP